jgi:hypothetical protein
MTRLSIISARLAWAMAMMIAAGEAGPALCAEFRATMMEEGSFHTNISGEPNFRPPYVQVIRTPDGLDYILSQYERMKDRFLGERLNMIKRKFGKVNFNEQMLIAVLSQPLDHFNMRYLGMDKGGGDGPITVRLSYRHDGRMTGKSGQKIIYYIIMVTPKSGQPVLLDARAESHGPKTPLKPERVTGVLMEYGDGKVQLVVETRARGKKSTFYVKGADLEALRGYLGKRVTLEGYIKPEGLSAYEREFTFLRIAKVLKPGEKGEEDPEEQAP